MLYRFKTFRTSYYFPDLEDNERFLYGLYHPFGSVKAKIAWYLFRRFRAVRYVFRTDPEKMPFAAGIAGVAPAGSRLSFCEGTPGKGQKVSVLGLMPDGTRFHGKYSTSDYARSLTRNESRILDFLSAEGLAPALLSFNEGEGYTWLCQSFVPGVPPSLDLCSDASFRPLVVSLAIRISELHAHPEADFGALRTGLSHGDFCQYNMLVSDGVLRLIDWEMAAERPLGYDLFKLIYQTARLFGDMRPMEELCRVNEYMLRPYFDRFGISDYSDYLEWFMTQVSSFSE